MSAVAKILGTIIEQTGRAAAGSDSLRRDGGIQNTREQAYCMYICIFIQDSCRCKTLTNQYKKPYNLGYKFLESYVKSALWTGTSTCVWLFLYMIQPQKDTNERWLLLCVLIMSRKNDGEQTANGLTVHVGQYLHHGVFGLCGTSKSIHSNEAAAEVGIGEVGVAQTRSLHPWNCKGQIKRVI